MDTYAGRVVSSAEKLEEHSGDSGNVRGVYALHRKECVFFEKWTHWDLNPGPFACEADVIPPHHVPVGGAVCATLHVSGLTLVCWTVCQINSLLFHVLVGVLCQDSVIPSAAFQMHQKLCVLSGNYIAGQTYSTQHENNRKKRKKNQTERFGTAR
jgi:hypothetical protein